jgi:hypothetical protein
VLTLVVSHICMLTFTIMMLIGTLRTHPFFSSHNQISNGTLYSTGTMGYSDVLRTCISMPPKALNAVYLTPVRLPTHCNILTERYISYSQIFVESMIALATLYHAWSFRSLRANMPSNSVRTIVHALHIDGFMYYVVSRDNA